MRSVFFSILLFVGIPTTVLSQLSIEDQELARKMIRVHMQGYTPEMVNEVYGRVKTAIEFAISDTRRMEKSFIYHDRVPKFDIARKEKFMRIVGDEYLSQYLDIYFVDIDKREEYFEFIILRVSAWADTESAILAHELQEKEMQKPTKKEERTGKNASKEDNSRSMVKIIMAIIIGFAAILTIRMLIGQEK
jgi:hypothetical protein